MFIERPWIILKYIALIYLFESIVSGVHTENNNIKYKIADLDILHFLQQVLFSLSKPYAANIKLFIIFIFATGHSGLLYKQET